MEYPGDTKTFGMDDEYLLGMKEFNNTIIFKKVTCKKMLVDRVFKNHKNKSLFSKNFVKLQTTISREVDRFELSI